MNFNLYFKNIRMYAKNTINNGLQMNSFGQGTGITPMTNMNLNAGLNNSFLFFSGTAPSLQARIESISDQELNRIADINIQVTGIQVKPMNNLSYCCTFIWGSLIVFPLLLMCCGWWRSCTYPHYDIPESIYNLIARLIRGSSIRNITLNVQDNYFGSAKANILAQALEQSYIKGLTFNNNAMAFNARDSEYSNFEKNMAPIRQMTNIMSDIRWNDQCMM